MEEEGQDNTYQSRPKRWESEDTTPTTDRELKGWYSYGLAAEVFAVCGVGSFLPVTLEQLAKEHGVLRSDGVTPCVDVPKAVVENGSRLLVRTMVMLQGREDGEKKTDVQCVVRPFGKDVSTASFAMYTFSVAVLVQAVVLVSFSSFADHGTYRKKLLMAFAAIGSLSCMMFIFITPSIYLLGSVLVILGVSSLGSSFVLLNSFLPLLAANHPSVSSSQQQQQQRRKTSSSMSSFDIQEPNEEESYSRVTNDEPHQQKKTTSPALALSTKISAKGVGIGYIAAVFVQLISIGILFSLSKLHFASASIPLRVVLLIVGIWWATFSIPCYLYLRDRPGPPLKPLNNRFLAPGKPSQILSYLTFAWTSIFHTLKTACKLRQTITFLLAWFLLSDSIATVSGTAILFARTELHMETVQIAILSITATSSGIAGAFLWPTLSKRYNLDIKQTILCCILLMEIIPLYGLLGYLPFIQNWGVGGLQQAWEIYPLGVVHGFVMGGLSSYCRSFYGLLIPPGQEAAFFALYAVTDKGSSAIGPAVVGLIVDGVGSIRPAFGFLAVLIVAPVPLVWLVDVEAGRRDAVRIAGGSDVGVGNERDGGGEDAQGLLAREDRDD